MATLITIIIIIYLAIGFGIAMLFVDDSARGFPKPSKLNIIFSGYFMAFAWLFLFAETYRERIVAKIKRKRSLKR